jgi:hypothetical protein|tara:strand:- start:113 stop:364 length:252 start_codon:yes stop_codon:yes gene_type:complete
MITVNMTKAREIKKEQLRQERKPLLEKLDVQYMRAIESGDTDEQASIATKKQQLRDITADAGITNATTADQLKAVRPTILDNV